MKHLDFITHLSNLKPTRESLLTKGLSEAYIEGLLASYTIAEKEISEEVNLNDELIVLINKYDLSKVEIGLVTFLANAYEENGYLFLGKVEVDDLCLDLTTLEIMVKESGTNRIPWKCAKDGELFLSALIRLAKFLEDRSNDDALWEDEDLGRSVAKLCAEDAGGSSYLSFYQMLLD